MFKKTYIIIDGLDEVFDDIRAHFLKVLSLLRENGASLLLTSRPLQLLEPLLPDAAFIQIDDENQKDIDLFIDKKFEEEPHLTSLLEGRQRVREETCAKFKEKSRGMCVSSFSLLLIMLTVDCPGSC
jgi:hypothetical protein